MIRFAGSVIVHSKGYLDTRYRETILHRRLEYMGRKNRALAQFTEFIVGQTGMVPTYVGSELLNQPDNKPDQLRQVYTVILSVGARYCKFEDIRENDKRARQ